jgi:NDP-sugar pyrophosphorylase family protein
MIEVAGKPFLLHQLRLLAQRGATRVVLCVGYLGEQIEQRIGGNRFGIEIDYSYDGPGLDGTLGAVRRAAAILPDRFLILYGDTYLRLDYRAAARAWEQSGRLALMTVIQNDDRWDRSNAVYADQRVLVYDKERRMPAMRWIDYGLGGLRQDALTVVREDERDLAVLYRRLAEIGELCGVEVEERFFEIGTPESLTEADRFLQDLSEGSERPQD